MTKEEVYDAIVEEIKTIREKTTPEEKAKLNMSQFNRYSPIRCIYGLMTGICTSDRAKELVPKSVTIYPTFGENNIIIGFFGSSAITTSTKSYTLLEVALFNLSNIIVNNIINYIKEETDQLILTIDDIKYKQYSAD